MIQIDMAMPENCRMCPVCSEYDICLIPVGGKGFGEQNVSEFTEGRPEWCPMKEQEPVEPEVEVLNEIDRLYRCPKCHKCFFYEKQKYCDQCGQEVKWE